MQHLFSITGAKMSETVTGYIDHIIFRNDQNGYTVMVLKQTGEEELTCVGTFPDISQEPPLRLRETISTIRYMENSFRLPLSQRKCRRTLLQWSVILDRAP